MTMNMGFRWDHTAWLNAIFLAVTAPLLWRFFRSGGPDMLRRMNEPMEHGNRGGGEMHHHPAHGASQ